MSSFSSRTSPLSRIRSRVHYNKYVVFENFPSLEIYDSIIDFESSEFLDYSIFDDKNKILDSINRFLDEFTVYYEYIINTYNYIEIFIYPPNNYDLPIEIKELKENIEVDLESIRNTIGSINNYLTELKNKFVIILNLLNGIYEDDSNNSASTSGSPKRWSRVYDNNTEILLLKQRIGFEISDLINNLGIKFIQNLSEFEHQNKVINDKILLLRPEVNKKIREIELKLEGKNFTTIQEDKYELRNKCSIYTLLNRRIAIYDNRNGMIKSKYETELKKIKDSSLRSVKEDYSTVGIEDKSRDSLEQSLKEDHSTVDNNEKIKDLFNKINTLGEKKVSYNGGKLHKKYSIRKKQHKTKKTFNHLYKNTLFVRNNIKQKKRLIVFIKNTNFEKTQIKGLFGAKRRGRPICRSLLRKINIFTGAKMKMNFAETNLNQNWSSSTLRTE